MDRRLIERALGVPDAIVLVENRERAGAAKLAELLEEPLLASADVATKLESWLAHFASQAEGGVLDGLLGGFEPAEDAAKRLASLGPADGFGWDLSHRLTSALVEAVQTFVTLHPFKDEAGHYFS